MLLIRIIFLLLALPILLVISPITEMGHNLYLNEIIAPNVVHFERTAKDFFSGKMKTGIFGTGSQINYKGKQYIVTNKHICEHAPAIKMIKNEKHLKVNGIYRKILDISIIHDLCLVEPLP